jgi:hypothetical protein
MHVIAAALIGAAVPAALLLVLGGIGFLIERRIQREDNAKKEGE